MASYSAYFNTFHISELSSYIPISLSYHFTISIIPSSFIPIYIAISKITHLVYAMKSPHNFITYFRTDTPK